MKIVKFKLEDLSEFHQQVQKYLFDQDKEITNSIDVIARMLHTIIEMEGLEEYYYGAANHDPYDTIFHVLEKMKSGEIKVDVEMSKEELQEFIKNNPEICKSYNL